MVWSKEGASSLVNDQVVSSACSGRKGRGARRAPVRWLPKENYQVVVGKEGSKEGASSLVNDQVVR